MATRDYEGIKFKDASLTKVLDTLTVEEALQININDTPFTVSMRSPGDDRNLVRGLLHSEGIIKTANFLPEMEVAEKNDEGVVTIINVTIPESQLGEGYLNSRSLLSVSSCGICGKTELGDLEFTGERLQPNVSINNTLIGEMFTKMSQLQHSFKASGGTHAAAAFDLQGHLLTAMEDIGRHNAVDKVIGALILNDQLSKAKVLTVSGRISYEIVVKCFKGQIPFLAAVSAPSSLAVDYAKELGITLFAFCRSDRATCYANAQYLEI